MKYIYSPVYLTVSRHEHADKDHKHRNGEVGRRQTGAQTVPQWDGGATSFQGRLPVLLDEVEVARDIVLPGYDSGWASLDRLEVDQAGVVDQDAGPQGAQPKD